MHRHDHHARQRSNTTDERTELVVGPHHAQCDRLLGVELFLALAGRLEQLVLDPGRQRSLRDVHDQIRHLRLARQLAEHLLQLLFHLRQLLLQRLQVGSAPLLVLELAAQLGFLAFQLLEFGLLAAHEQPPAQQDDDHGHDHAEPHLCLARPATDVVDVEFLEVDLLVGAHGAAPPAAGAAGVAAGAVASPPSPSSLGAFGLASLTLRLNS